MTPGQIPADRLFLRGELVALTPVATGAGEGEGDVDLPVLKGSDGRALVAGSGVKGALRSWMCRAVEHAPKSARQDLDTALAVLLGGSSGDAAAGALYVEDASVSTVPIHRDGVGIDRHTGSAAEDVLFVREAIPAGATIPLRIEVELPAAITDTGVLLLGSALSAMCEGRIRLGAGTTRGLGRVALREVKTIGFGLTTEPKAEMLRLLAHLNPDQPAADWQDWAPPEDPLVVPWCELRIGFEPDGVLLVGDGVDGLVIDAMPLTARSGDRVRLCLPGSSVKGSLRSHAEWQIRTVLGADVPAGRSLADQLAAPGLELAEQVFGAAPGARGEGGRLGAVGVDDCLSASSWAAPEWDAVAAAATGQDPDRLSHLRPLLNRLNNSAEVTPPAGTHQPDGPGEASVQGIDPPELQVAHHVSIDRWSGGAATGRLFSVLEPHGVRWGELVLDIDPDRLGSGESARAAVHLLLRTLWDLCDGAVQFGADQTTGCGAIKVSSVTVEGSVPEGHVLEAVLAPGAVEGLLTRTDPRTDGPPSDWVDAVEAAFTHYQHVFRLCRYLAGGSNEETAA